MRSIGMQQFVTALNAAFERAVLAPPARAAVDRVFHLAATPAPAPAPALGTPASMAGEELAILALLPAALAPLMDRKDALGNLARALAALAPDLVWSTRKSIGPTASAGFAQAHANCFVMGPGAIEARDDLWIGISLMAPGSRYPDHDHAPEEVYLALSPGAFWHGDAEWVTPGVGGTIHNLPGIRHAMRAADAPFLAIWVLPVQGRRKRA